MPPATGKPWNCARSSRIACSTCRALAREILEFLCLAAQGLSTPVLFAAAENEDVTERADTLALLIRERLARSATVDAERRIEPAHDQVRAAVVAMLPEHTRRARHARLAHVLAAQPDIEPQVLVTHYQEAGDLRRRSTPR